MDQPVETKPTITKTMSLVPGEPCSWCIYLKTSQSLETLKEILNRALNTWPDCPAEFKEFADVVISGAIQQKYYDLPAIGSKVRIHLDKGYHYLHHSEPSTKGTLNMRYHPDVMTGDLPICSDCGGHGHGHQHNCPVIRRD